MSLTTNSQNALNDYAIIPPLQRVAFFSPHTQPANNNPPEWIPTFRTPKYQPAPNDWIPLNNQATGNRQVMCPQAPIIIRHKWELQNTSNPVVNGGFDRYNSLAVPSCSEKTDKYLTFIDSVNPAVLAFVNKQDEHPVIWETHNN